MALASTSGPMGVCMKAILLMEKGKARENGNHLQGISLKDNILKT